MLLPLSPSLPPAPYFNQQTNANHEVKALFKNSRIAQGSLNHGRYPVTVNPELTSIFLFGIAVRRDRAKEWFAGIGVKRDEPTKHISKY